MVDELLDEGRWEVRKLHLERSNWVGADKERAGMLAQPDDPARSAASSAIRSY